MESAQQGPWKPYGTPVTVEKTTFARSGQRGLRVVTDNKQTMGGNFEGVSRRLGNFEAGDLLLASFWFYAKGGKNITVGLGRTSFESHAYFSGSDWTRAEISLRCSQKGHYNIWVSQGNEATEFFLDDFSLEVIKRPNLGRAEKSQLAQLQGGPLRLTFCVKTGALAGVENLATGEVYAPVGQRQPLFGMELLSADGMGYDRVPFDKMRLVTIHAISPRSLSADFESSDLAIKVSLHVKMSEDGAAAFAGTIRNNSHRKVTALELPILFGVCPAADPRRLTLVAPNTTGRIIPNAIETTGCFTTYPGQAVMGWLDLSGEQGGVYLATHDKTSIGTRLMAVPAPGPTFDMSLTKEILVRPGETFTLPEAVVAVHLGDWHASADRYRAWARTWMKRPRLPKWIQEADGWVLMGIQNGIPFHRIPDVFRQAQWMGVEYLHIQGEGIDNMWFDAEGKRHSHEMTYPYPSPKFGTPEELKAAIAKVHEAGGHIMFYFLYERWTPSHSTSDHFGTGTRADVPKEFLPPGLDFYYDNALLERPGVRLPTEHPFMGVRLMCLGAPGWREWMRRWAIDVYAKQYGADGFYWDVMGRNGPFRCFNQRHGHEGQNDWAAGCAKVLQTVIEQGLAINPDYASAIEGCSDVLGQWNGFHLMSGGSLNPNVFRYTFPDYLCVDGFSNTTWKLSQPEKARRVFLDGERFDLHGYHQVVKHIINLRRRIKPFIDWPAVFKDTVGVKASDERVQARAFWRTDGTNRAIAITMMNEEHLTTATVEVELSPIGRPCAVHIFRLNGRVERVPIGGDKIQVIPVPPDDVSAALIVNAVAPGLSVLAWLEQIVRPNVDGAALALFFPSGATRATECEVQWPSGFSPEVRQVLAESDCLQRTEYFDANRLRGLKRWSKVTAHVRWNGGECNPWTVLAPPLVNGDFEQVEDGRLVQWGVPPCVENPPEGRYCVRVDRQHMPHGHVAALTPLKPGSRYRFTCLVKRVGAKGAAAHAVEYEEGQRFVRSATLKSTKRGEWERLETVFVAHPNPRSSAVYLYNFDESSPAWFDGLELEEVP